MHVEALAVVAAEESVLVVWVLVIPVERCLPALGNYQPPAPYVHSHPLPNHLMVVELVLVASLLVAVVVVSVELALVHMS